MLPNKKYLIVALFLPSGAAYEASEFYLYQSNYCKQLKYHISHFTFATSLLFLNLICQFQNVPHLGKILDSYV